MRSNVKWIKRRASLALRYSQKKHRVVWFILVYYTVKLAFLFVFVRTELLWVRQLWFGFNNYIILLFRQALADWKWRNDSNFSRNATRLRKFPYQKEKILILFAFWVTSSNDKRRQILFFFYGQRTALMITFSAIFVTLAISLIGIAGTKLRTNSM